MYANVCYDDVDRRRRRLSLVAIQAILRQNDNIALVKVYHLVPEFPLELLVLNPQEWQVRTGCGAQIASDLAQGESVIKFPSLLNVLKDTY